MTSLKSNLEIIRKSADTLVHTYTGETAENCSLESNARSSKFKAVQNLGSGKDFFDAAYQIYLIAKRLINSTVSGSAIYADAVKRSELSTGEELRTIDTYVAQLKTARKAAIEEGKELLEEKKHKGKKSELKEFIKEMEAADSDIAALDAALKGINERINFRGDSGRGRGAGGKKKT